MNVWDKFRNLIKKEELVMHGDRILLAVSGGPDSVCLTHLFWRLKKTVEIELSIVYFDHGLRRQAGKEVVFVNKLGCKLGIPVYIQKLPVKEFSKKNKISVETAGRDLRYKNLEDLARKLKFNKIATGHNANDNAETMIMWLLRGTGMEGMSGIPISRTTENKIKIIRPILAVTKKEILNYLAGQKMPFRVDRSNLSLDYTRNKIRHNIVPMLAKYNPCIVEHLYNLSRIVSGENAYLNKLAKSAQRNTVTKSKNKITLDLKGFFGYNKTIQTRIIKAILPQKCSLSQIERLMESLSAPNRKHIDFSNDWKIEKKTNKLVFKKA
jgi:tRNA(Ile)-lysidine synthase